MGRNIYYKSDTKRNFCFYSKNIKKYRQHVKFLSIFYHKRLIVFQLIEERMAIMRFLKNAKDEYIVSVQLEA